jgi:hypothetical protein
MIETDLQWNVLSIILAQGKYDEVKKLVKRGYSVTPLLIETLYQLEAHNVLNWLYQHELSAEKDPSELKYRKDMLDELWGDYIDEETRQKIATNVLRAAMIAQQNRNESLKRNLAEAPELTEEMVKYAITNNNVAQLIQRFGQKAVFRAISIVDPNWLDSPAATEYFTADFLCQCGKFRPKLQEIAEKLNKGEDVDEVLADFSDNHPALQQLILLNHPKIDKWLLQKHPDLVASYSFGTYQRCVDHGLVMFDKWVDEYSLMSEHYPDESGVMVKFFTDKKYRDYCELVAKSEEAPNFLSFLFFRGHLKAWWNLFRLRHQK